MAHSGVCPLDGGRVSESKGLLVCERCGYVAGEAEPEQAPEYETTDDDDSLEDDAPEDETETATPRAHHAHKKHAKKK